MVCGWRVREKPIRWDGFNLELSLPATMLQSMHGSTAHKPKCPPLQHPHSQLHSPLHPPPPALPHLHSSSLSHTQHSPSSPISPGFPAEGFFGTADAPCLSHPLKYSFLWEFQPERIWVQEVLGTSSRGPESRAGRGAGRKSHVHPDASPAPLQMSQAALSCHGL